MLICSLDFPHLIRKTGCFVRFCFLIVVWKLTRKFSLFLSILQYIIYFFFLMIFKLFLFLKNIFKWKKEIAANETLFFIKNFKSNSRGLMNLNLEWMALSEIQLTIYLCLTQNNLWRNLPFTLFTSYLASIYYLIKEKKNKTIFLTIYVFLSLTLIV